MKTKSLFVGLRAKTYSYYLIAVVVKMKKQKTQESVWSKEKLNLKTRETV